MQPKQIVLIPCGLKRLTWPLALFVRGKNHLFELLLLQSLVIIGQSPFLKWGLCRGQGNFGRGVEWVSMWVVSKCSSASYLFIYFFSFQFQTCLSLHHRRSSSQLPNSSVVLSRLWFLDCSREHVDCKVCTAVCVMSAFHLLFKPMASCLPQPSSEPSRLLFFYAHSPFRSPSSYFFL